MDSTISTPKLIGALFQLFLFPAILFLFAGDWRWTEGWVFSVIFLAMCYGTLVYLYFHDPALLRERFGSPFQDRYQITVSVLPERLQPGPIRGSIIIKTNDPEFPQLVVPVEGAILGAAR